MSSLKETCQSNVFEMLCIPFTHSLADVLSCEDHVTGLTSEAADVPLLLQRQERLTLLDLVSTPSTVWRRVQKERVKDGKRGKGGAEDFLNSEPRHAGSTTKQSVNRTGPSF